MGLKMATPWKHPDTGIFYVYERVPTDVLGVAKGRIVTVQFGEQSYQVKLGTHVRLSLRTKDGRTAKGRYREAAASLQDHYGLMRRETLTGPVSLTQRQIEAIAGEYYRSQTVQHQDSPGDPEGWDAALSVLGEAGETPAGVERLHGDEANRLLHTRGLSIDATSRALLLEAMHRAYMMFAAAQERRGLGDYRPDRQAERFPEFPA
ncbi:DUF6538 domain-containing protein [Palleronia sediminis]|uniref:DUF6538 domain-containing protein n=1 Tax=Palleronia sediminis TaxID=2547833 RepID=UPI001059CD8C|nr:DUF6538 domain-containing protein [Palleronia sediminis]